METLKRKRIESMEIVLEHDIDEQYQYMPGEMMHGVIVIKSTEEIAINSLSVTLKGEGSCTWEGGPSNKKGVRKFKSKEIYLDITENLITTSAHVSSEVLEEGTHEYPFFCELPDSLPSSYIGKYGSVTYLVKAQVRPDRKYGSDAMITSEPFLVLRKYDLSLEPYKLQSYEETASRGGGMACICAGKIKADIKLNRTAFIPGEDLRLNAQVRNGSSREITAIQGALLMTSTFYANNETIKHDQMINKHVDAFSIDQGEGRRWNNIRLTIPPYIPESALEGCDIIDVHYALFFMVEVDGDSKSKHNLQIHVPLTVGTHGIQADDDPEDDPGLRPLYHRTDNMEPPLAIDTHMDDDMEQIDHSLFDGSGDRGGPQRGGSSKQASAGGRTNLYVKRNEPKRQPNMVHALYGDLMDEDDLPDNKPDPELQAITTDKETTEAEESIKPKASNTGSLKKPSRKKKAAPDVPESTELHNQRDNNNDDDQTEGIEDQTRL